MAISASSLSLSCWPLDDRNRWADCFESDDLFDDKSGAYLSESTRYGRRTAYGQWLDFLEALYPECLDLPAPDRITVSHLENYVTYLRENCRETTIAHLLARLFHVVRSMYPERDWGWLYRIARRITGQAEPIRHPTVLSGDLYQVGLRLMQKALARSERAAHVTKSAALMYCDGLLIATLVEAPMRRRPFSSLRINEHLLRIGDLWEIVIPEELTKTRLAQEYRLSPRLSKALDIYLERFRPAFPGADCHDWLWTHVGRPMTAR